MLSVNKYIVSTVFFILASAHAIAQCPMCKMAAESNLENGGSAGAGLNTGILFMLSMPYLIVAVFGYIWFMNKRKEQEEYLLKEANDVLKKASQKDLG